MNTEQKHTLLPCPFCGGKAKEYDSFNANTVTCLGCGLKVRQSEMGQGDASERWNRRAALQSQKPKGNDIMLSGVIRMPFEMAMVDTISRMQFYQRAQQVLNELEAMQSQSREDAERLDWLIEHINDIDIDDGHRGWFILERGTSNYITEDNKTAREAIDHARNIVGGKDAISVD